MPDLLRRTALAPAAVLAAGAAGAVYLYGTDPHQPGHLLPVCPFRLLTGWLCPACGATRMTYDLLHGNVRHAWQDNALMLLLAPLLLWLLLRWCVAGLRGRTCSIALPRWGPGAVLGVAFGWAVLRNAV